MKKTYAFLAALLTAGCRLSAQEVAPCPPLPSPQQVAWHQMETYAFIHFGPNTFTNREWGYGDAPLSCFNPTQLDCEQWVRTFKEAGMKGVILTAKHHDGFCLWPSVYTDYSVRNTPWRDGKGDVVGELAAACKKYGLKLGLYLSPWDRHQAFYGTPLYVQYYHLQMEELLSKYGPVFEVWLDGANGGDGWYGGAKEKRQIDRATYYNYDRIHQIVFKHNPETIIFSDGGPGCRWVGNEVGVAGTTNWSFLRGKEVYPGYPKYQELNSGHADGDAWMGGECDVSIRPGWFWRQSEDEKVKTVDQLTNIYYCSVGRNANMLLGFPVDTRGLISPIDSANAVNFYKRIQKELSVNLLLNRKNKVTDGQFDTYQVLATGTPLELKLARRSQVDRVMLQEYIPLGQRVRSFRVEYLDGKEWKTIPVEEETTTIGYKRILRFNPVETKRLRLTILDSRTPENCLSEVAAFWSQAK